MGCWGGTELQRMAEKIGGLMGAVSGIVYWAMMAYFTFRCSEEIGGAMFLFGVVSADAGAINRAFFLSNHIPYKRNPAPSYTTPTRTLSPLTNGTK